MKRIFFIALLAMALVDAWACTAVIASGRATADGRPFIFKNRDASDGTNNSLLALHGAKYDYVGVVNYSSSSSPACCEEDAFVMDVYAFGALLRCSAQEDVVDNCYINRGDFAVTALVAVYNVAHVVVEQEVVECCDVD